jgi:hypothetical protein
MKAILELDVPKSCKVCPLKIKDIERKVLYGYDEYYCCYNKISVTFNTKDRHSNCPLKLVDYPTKGKEQ